MWYQSKWPIVKGWWRPTPLLLSKRLVYYVNIACSITKGNGACWIKHTHTHTHTYAHAHVRAHTHTHTKKLIWWSQKHTSFIFKNDSGLKRIEYCSGQGCRNLVCHVSMGTTFCMVVPNIYWSSVWNLLHVTILAPRMLWWLLDFWKTCASLA